MKEFSNSANVNEDDARVGVDLLLVLDEFHDFEEFKNWVEKLDLAEDCEVLLQ